MEKTCTGCVVSAGTHKPADAVHQIDEPQAKAMRLADECEESAANWVNEIDTRLKAAKMLRDQHARIEDIEAQHREELRAYEITVANREARIAELEGQLEAIGAGGVEPLRKQAAAQQAVPEQSVPVGYVALAALTSRTHADDYAKCFATEAALIENYPAAKVIAVYDHAATQPAAQGMEQDAARYHWLRKSPNPACDIALAKHFGGGRGQDFDALIDAALAAQAKQGGAA